MMRVQEITGSVLTQLLRSGDPHRMRSKILAPLMDEVHKRDRRIAELETALAESREDVEFHESSSLELLEIIDALKVHFELNWGDLLALPASEGLAAVLAWIEAAIVRGGDHGSIIPNLSAFNEADLDFSALYEAEKEGEESARKSISEPGAPE